MYGGIATGDLDGDGALDLVVAGHPPFNAPGKPGLELLFGDGKGGVGNAVSVATGLALTGDVVITDFNRDGRPDIAAALESEVTIVLGGGNRRFAVAASYPTTRSGGAMHMVMGDFNEDGHADLMVGNGGTVTWSAASMA